MSEQTVKQAYYEWISGKKVNPSSKTKKVEEEVVAKEKKEPNLFRPKIRSPHPTHDILRTNLPLLPFPSLVRLGSKTELTDKFTKNGKRICLNSVNAIENSSNKKLMKECFSNYGVETAEYIIPKDNNLYVTSEGINFGTEQDPYVLKFPLIFKKYNGSRNRGNVLIKNEEDAKAFIQNKCLTEYVIEKYYTYVREYRIHVINGKAVYATRKMLKSDTPDDKRWFRNDSNCVWINQYESELDENGKFVKFTDKLKDDFDQPVNWEQIVEHAVLAIKSVGLDFGAVDLKVEGAIDKNGNRKKSCKFIIIETNSAPSFGDVASKIYSEELPSVLKQKFENSKKSPYGSIRLSSAAMEHFIGINDPNNIVMNNQNNIVQNYQPPINILSLEPYITDNNIAAGKVGLLSSYLNINYYIGNDLMEAPLEAIMASIYFNKKSFYTVTTEDVYQQAVSTHPYKQTVINKLGVKYLNYTYHENALGSLKSIEHRCLEKITFTLTNLYGITYMSRINPAKVLDINDRQVFYNHALAAIRDEVKLRRSLVTSMIIFYVVDFFSKNQITNPDIISYDAVAEHISRYVAASILPSALITLENTRANSVPGNNFQY